MSKHSCSYATHAQIQDFFSGEWGGGVQAQRPENSLDNVFSFFLFLVLN